MNAEGSEAMEDERQGTRNEDDDAVKGAPSTGFIDKRRLPDSFTALALRARPARLPRAGLVPHVTPCARSPRQQLPRPEAPTLNRSGRRGASRNRNSQLLPVYHRPFV